MRRNMNSRIIIIFLALSLILTIPGIAYGSGAEEQLAEIQEKAQKAEQEKNDLVTRIDGYQKRLLELDDEVEKTKQKIETKNTEIEEISAEIETVKQNISDRKEGISDRVRTMYKNGTASWLDILFGSRTFSELLSNVSMLQRIYQSDQAILDRFESKYGELAVVLEKYETAQAELNEAVTELANQQDEIVSTEASLAVEVEKYDEMLLQYQEEAANLKIAIAEEQAAREAELERIRQEQAEAARRQAEEEAARQAEEEAARQAAEEEAARQAEEEAQQQEEEPAEEPQEEEPTEEPQEEEPTEEPQEEEPAEEPQEEEPTEEPQEEEPAEEPQEEEPYEEPAEEEPYEEPDYGSTNLNWPVGGTVTYGYGDREAPVDGASTYHEGIDIAADVGSGIYASASGIVGGETGWYGGYGLAVVIYHGDGLVTIYGHCDSICVSPGEYVEAGQLIGYVGMTGVTSGPHCHFEVIDGGASVDPFNYL